MKTPTKVIVVALLLHGFLPWAMAHDEPAEEMTAAAKNFLAALSSEQKAKATFELTNDERQNWHFIPKPRKGLPFKEMSSGQRALAHALLSTGLSHRGYFKATTIMSLEEILKELEQGKGPTRDPELYYLSIFGTPSDSQTWAWRCEGHHVSLNFTIVDGQSVTATPSFLGSNPAEVRTGPRQGLRVLGAEEDLGRKLVLSLTPDQLKLALYTNIAPSDIITGTDRKAHVLDPKGITLKQLDPKQAELFWQLVTEYIYRERGELAGNELAKLKTQALETLFFAWAGSLETGKGHYYRVQGPTFLLEYDNTQNNANHIHSVWRDLEHDFGGDLLRKHYDEVPHPQGTRSR